MQPRVEKTAPQQVWQQTALNYWSIVNRLASDVLRLQRQRQDRLLGSLLGSLVSQTHLMPQHWSDKHKNSCSLLGLQYALRMLLQLGPGTQAAVVRELQLIFKQQLKTWHAHCKQDAAKQLHNLGQMHKYLKKDEQSYIRPYDAAVVDERPQLRRDFWVNIWGEETAPQSISEELWYQAVMQRRAIKPLSSKQLWHTVHTMHPKEEGLDGWTLHNYQQLPWEAFSGLAWAMSSVEESLEWPSTAKIIGIALLPKNLEEERSIALTPYLCRIWLKARNFLRTQWLQANLSKSPWDYAVPSMTVMDLALATWGQRGW